MSKEMLMIVLGVWIVVLTQLGLPYHPWGVALFVITGAAVAVVGFLLRGEALARGTRSKHVTFVENIAAQMPLDAQPAETHDHKEGITSLN